MLYTRGSRCEVLLLICHGGYVPSTPEYGTEVSAGTCQPLTQASRIPVEVEAAGGVRYRQTAF